MCGCECVCLWVCVGVFTYFPPPTWDKVMVVSGNRDSSSSSSSSFSSSTAAV